MLRSWLPVPLYVQLLKVAVQHLRLPVSNAQIPNAVVELVAVDVVNRVSRVSALHPLPNETVNHAPLLLPVPFQIDGFVSMGAYAAQ